MAGERKNNILILSNDDDISTTNVIRWIYILDDSINVIRLSPSELYNCQVNINNINSSLLICCNNKKIDTSTISVVWTRKWDLYPPISMVHDSKLNIESALTINQNLRNEFFAFYSFFINKIDENNVFWLNHPKFKNINKLEQLLVAQTFGFKIPNTYLSTNLENYSSSKKISKHLSDCISVYKDGTTFTTLTTEVKNGEKNDFFVSLFQEKIKKELEIRVFYLCGKCYAISIISQKNSKTKIDYRNYDYKNPNREVFYNLPSIIEEQIGLLMNYFNLQTGSLDFILTPNNEYIFLEINPSGQYDVFNLFNVYPDYLIAKKLIEKNNEN